MRAMDFPGGSDGKDSACNAGDPGSIPRLGRPLGDGNGNPSQYSCLENSMDRGAWRAIVHGVSGLDPTEQLTPTHTHTPTLITGPGGGVEWGFGTSPPGSNAYPASSVSSASPSSSLSLGFLLCTVGRVMELTLGSVEEIQCLMPVKCSVRVIIKQSW